MKKSDGFGNPKNEQLSYNRSLDGSTLTINFNDGGGSVDFNVTVPNNVNVQLKTSSGNVDVEGVSGQILMTTGSGNITATNDIFTGSTTLSTGSGDITFDGGITGTGDYQFTTGNGEIDANLTSGTALDINAATDNGSINSQVSTVSVQNNDPGATASGHIGSPNNSTRLTLKTGEGSINLNNTR